jgi:hypothetical protein
MHGSEGGRWKRGDDGIRDRYPWAPARKGRKQSSRMPVLPLHHSSTAPAAYPTCFGGGTRRLAPAKADCSLHSDSHPGALVRSNGPSLMIVVHTGKQEANRGGGNLLPRVERMYEHRDRSSIHPGDTET